MYTEAEVAPASKTSRKYIPKTILPIPPSKPAPAPTLPCKTAAAPRPKTFPAPSPILKTPKRKEVAADDEEIEVYKNGMCGDSPGRWSAGNSLPCLLFYVLQKVYYF